MWNSLPLATLDASLTKDAIFCIYNLLSMRFYQMFLIQIAGHRSGTAVTLHWIHVCIHINFVLHIYRLIS